MIVSTSMKPKKKIKSKIKILAIILFVVAFGLVLASAKVIRINVNSDTLPTTDQLPSNFKDISASAGVSLNDIRDSSSKNVILFSSSWCGSCNKLIQDMSQLAKDYPSINMYIMDLESQRDTANALNVPVTPTLVLLEAGETKNYTEVTIDNLSSIISDFNRIGIR